MGVLLISNDYPEKYGKEITLPRSGFVQLITSNIQAQHAKKLRMQLAARDTAHMIEEVDIPDFAPHPLKGDRAGVWSISVSGNWRVTFEFRDGNG
tara:strand:+ start:2083 stop:2367 length:285 start_codon:yes stop_codon:yes gene_type:complete